MTSPTAASSPPPVLHIDQLTAGHPGEAPVLTNWSATFGPGVTLLYGDSGSGKTTLLKGLAGQLPASGRVWVHGRAANARADVLLADAAASELQDMTPEECATALWDDTPADRTAWLAAAHALGLEPHLGKKMFMLSTGSRRKVALAAALVSTRPVVLFDEPTSALDMASVRTFWQLLSSASSSRASQAFIVASYERPEALASAPVVELPAR